MENGLLISNESEEDTQKDKFLTFLIGEETYGLDIHYVTEIVGLQPITELPELPDFMKGIINLRGRIVPVMDVRIRFRKENRAYHDRTCIIIVHSGAVTLGLIVDEVAEVTTIPEQDIVMPPSLQGVAANRFMKAIGKVGEQVKLLLDCDRLVNGATVAEWDALTAQA
ncbi:purine-binding chemotaxis protein CheW [Hydrogenispora ethanolica]|uniref:Chemotaxis protein CheW n=1 Tax=Hydrogenispora ethanolica TaxID=1082276 RepID=A0A4R1RA41_HYDET|nr:chemotaxis protein CheW [Hydrogenispora ethanolica]TCL62566.1 purine-binding chemotaxis protein CheW [Hydrogenispora ethanolica]